MNKKRIIAILTAFILICCGMHASAYAEYIENDNVYNADGITIYFEEGLSDREKALIIAELTGEKADAASARGLTCTLFGHKLTTTQTVSIRHKVYSSAPRCVRDTYTVDVCSRCDYTSSTLSGSERIYCCA